METAATVPFRPHFVAERRRRAKPEVVKAGASIGSWRVDDVLGRGGMGAVYAVTHKKFGKRAALKLAHPSILDQPSLGAFEREAQIVHAVGHTGVTDVFATGRYDGRPYLVMEKLTGRTLADHRPDRAGAITYLRELCDVLRAAHRANIVHRDLTLANVFVLDEAYAGTRRIKLIDWGVAYVEGTDDPLTGMIAGTLTYVAPEQIRGDRLTGKADVYSLGVMAYELLLGKAPFAAADDLELLHKHMHKAPFDPRDGWARIPEPLAATLVAMLAKDPADRPDLATLDQTLEAAQVTLEQRRSESPSARGSSPKIEADAVQLAAGSGSALSTEDLADLSADVVLELEPEPEPAVLELVEERPPSPQAAQRADVLGRPILAMPYFGPMWLAPLLAFALVLVALLASP